MSYRMEIVEDKDEGGIAAAMGSTMPTTANPTAQGTFAYLWIFSKNGAKFVWNWLRTPVTPLEDTQYRKPVASEAIIWIRFSLAGVTRLILCTL